MEEKNTKKHEQTSYEHSDHRDEDTTTTNLGHSGYDDGEEVVILAAAIWQRLQQGLFDGGPAFEKTHRKP
ncbi:uncharacterized protein DS421_17g590100 [Arachis hypogaea]|nr:uncharacterized protein DS421_17g590100 [Arachis hypogaea]